MLWSKIFEETFEKTQWGKIDQACAFLRIYDIQLSILIFNFCLVWLTDYPTRGGFAPLGKNKLIIMIIRTCTKSQNHLWCWWRWWWRVGQNTNSSLNILSVGFHSVHQVSWCSSQTSRSRLGVCCLFLRPEGQAGSWLPPFEASNCHILGPCAPLLEFYKRFKIFRLICEIHAPAGVLQER